MSAERTEEFSQPLVTINMPVTENRADGDTTRNGAAADDATRTADTPKDAAREDSTAKSNERARSETEADKNRGPATEVSAAKVAMQTRLPALDDDADVGVQKEHIVTRDGKADLLFAGVLLASAAPNSAPKGRWQEYRIYQTNGEKHVFSKVTRTVVQEEEDTSEAEVFDPAPTSMPSQLLRSAREIARARPLTWMDAAVAFFGYDPLAKTLYRKLSVRFEEQIS
jgi:hypothetical protein